MKKWKGITKKLFSAFFAFALVATILPANVMAGTGTTRKPDVTWTVADIGDEYTMGTVIKGIKAETGGYAENRIYRYMGTADYMTIRTFYTNYDVTFSDTLGRKISKIVINLRDGSPTNFTAYDWEYASNNTKFVWEGAEPADEVILVARDAGKCQLEATSIDFYLEDSRTEPTADNLTYDGSTGLVSAQSAVDLGTVTTYYKVNDAWTTEKPTEVGTYEVGVVTAGSTTYKSLGTATEPFTASWIYEVKAADSGSGTTDTSKKDDVSLSTDASGKMPSDSAAAAPKTGDTTAPKTGDTTATLPFVLVLICGCGVIGAVIVRRKEVR